MPEHDAPDTLFVNHGLSTGEIAERLDMSRLDIIHVLRERGFRLLDMEPEQFRQAMQRPFWQKSTERGA